MRIIKEFKCVNCGDVHVVVVPEKDYEDWESGRVPIQNAMPYLDPNVREIFLSGWCGKCFDEFWKGLNAPDEG